MLNEACGIFGIFAQNENVANLSYFGILALQHRGQESSGIATSNFRVVRLAKQKGRVDRFTNAQITKLQGSRLRPAKLAIGHTRYSNTGSNIRPNFQPIVVKTAFGKLALAHNGNLVNPDQLASKLRDNGIIPLGSSDSELIALFIAYHSNRSSSIEVAIKKAMRELKGAYSLVIMTEDRLFGVRDPWGIRPLSLGLLNGGSYLLASETCAFEALGAKWVSDVNPGEIVIIGDSIEPKIIQAVPMISSNLCIFEFIYFANPGSILYDRLLQTARRHMGEMLWQEHPVEIDDPEDWVVCGVPDTGVPAAIGYADASGLQDRAGFIKNRYINRTFIEPDQRLRDLGVRAKLQALSREVLKKNVVVVEDSIVRGTTSGQIVKLLFEAGANSVHMRITSPPYRCRCHSGIDTQYTKELIAAQMTVEEIRQKIGADSLGYLSLEGVINAINKEKHLEPISPENFCSACFTGKYPFPVPEKQGRFVLEH